MYVKSNGDIKAGIRALILTRHSRSFSGLPSTITHKDRAYAIVRGIKCDLILLVKVANCLGPEASVAVEIPERRAWDKNETMSVNHEREASESCMVAGVVGLAIC